MLDLRNFLKVDRKEKADEIEGSQVKYQNRNMAGYGTEGRA